MFHTPCPVCGNDVVRDARRTKESKKMGWKTFCSQKCLGLSRLKGKVYECSREECSKTFFRRPSDLVKSSRLYCSHICAVIVSNRENPRNPGVIKICANCGKNFKSRKKYCSRKCKDLGSTISKATLLKQIIDFVDKNGRVPVKREFLHYHAIRSRFGNWNNAIRAAGFEPNPVMFANKHIAKDGDVCDSLAEMIIDNWLYKNRIKHERNYPYPGDKGFTVDFKIGNVWVEFFGLSGQLRRYDILKERKFRLAKKFGINLIRLYPDDLFPVNRLQDKFVQLKQISP